MVEVTVVLDEEELEGIFEDAEVRFSKAKLKKLKTLLLDQDLDVKERLEETLREYIEELVTDEWGE